MFEPTMIIAGASLVGLTIVAAALLRAWHGWLALKRQQLEQDRTGTDKDSGSSIGAARIELADLKERIKKLEAIASGVDL
ncbi:hypothetical protein [Erythrobacter sp.]|jgi:uncharacterized protein YecT (DUF1311 family)|uniref:hypothetical protein n=1 Tax=Erythrobacter sp. TaxID=1042 RepID=UPI001B1FC9AD|nr:hypothetical protein [Erythrobacter sp.]MBO6528163.1 hypothetical protein [Erythrobacter sp.]MBO6530705.1 hypothetical protein [Erythrobacter sp.]